ncbi:MAG: helix-turn-helix transcriptional regulator [Clostridia bacterium]|nr:helix-turn-helix transcriptional regulator [Clostridia bacterium]
MKKEPQKSVELLKPAITYLDAHLFDADLSFERAHKRAHISRTYFNKLFYQAYGCTPTAYVNGQRIERAKRLLISGGFSNEEIASLCGFNDVKYFYVIFKKLTGVTTKGYKKEFEKLHKKHFVSNPEGTHSNNEEGSSLSGK